MVLEEAMNWGGKGAQGKNQGDQEEGQGGRLGCGEKGHVIAICPQVRDAKRILKHLDQALKEGYKPKEERKGREGKPKRHLQVSATKERGGEDSGSSEAEEEDLSEESRPSVDHACRSLV